jgi:outer membrane receptor protein involved in Fe transport
MRIACRYALIFLVLAGVAAAQTPTPPEAPAKLEPFEVTGSRVKRLDYELPSPVVTYTVEDIAATGFATFGEFIQNLPFTNGDFNSELNPTGTFVPSAVTANPRGLGSNRLLTLVNGRRTVPFSFTNAQSGSPQSVFNFNSLPFDAVERVEYLKDGASALYGSDAITGVMNIILKKNFSGASLDLFASNPLNGGDAQTRRATLFAGGAKNGWDAMLGLTHQERHASYLSDFGVRSTDYRYLGAKGSDFRSIFMPPSFLNLTAAQATATGIGTAAGYYVIAGGVPTNNPNKTSFTYAGPTTASLPDANRYDNVSNLQINPASESTGVFGTVGRRLTSEVSAYAQFTLNRSQTYYEDMPVNGSSDIFTLAAANPYNPLGISLPGSRFAFSTGDFQPRSKVSSQALTAAAGLRGSMGKIWEWESAVNYGRDHSIYAADMSLLAEVQAAFTSPNRATAYNPFGPSDNPNLMPDLFRYRIKINDNLADAIGATFTLSGKPWQIPLRGAGELGLAAGYEFRHESLDVRTNETNYFAAIGAAQLPWAAQRDIHALSAEFTVPLQKWLEFQLAVRSEHYSDFGSTTNPKLGVALRLPEMKFAQIMLRGSYSESFKAPDFGQLYQPETVATGRTFVDPLRPKDGSRTSIFHFGGDPDLGPERGKVQYAGAVFDVKAIRGLSFTVDFLDIQIRGAINQLDLAYVLSPEGMRLFPDAIVRDNSVENPGPISYFNTFYRNHGYQLYRGWDYGVRYASPRTRWGRFTFNAQATQVVKKGNDNGTGAGFVDNTGNGSTPVWRSNLTAGWSRGNVSAIVAANVIGKLYNRRFTSTGWGENLYAVITPTLTYRGFERTTLSLSCGNALDHRPPANGRLSRGFDYNVYGVGASGRTLSLRARRDF